MRSSQGTNFFDEVFSLLDKTSQSSQLLQYLFGKINLGFIHQDSQTKYCRTGVINLLILFKLISVKSIHACFHSDLNSLLPMGKDVLYKVLNSPMISWRNMLYRQAKDCLDCSKKPEVDDSPKPWSKSCFIIDDTDIPKRGKCFELVGRIHSHLTRKYIVGFKCVNLAYWTGNHLLHLDNSLHVEMGKKENQGMSSKELKKRFIKERGSHTKGAKRVLEAFNKKTDQAVQMLRRALSKGFIAEYVLADSWYFCEKLLSFSRENGLKLISRIKLNNWLYTFEGKDYTPGNLLKKLQRSKKKKKWSRIIGMYQITVSVEFMGHPVKLFFYKEKKRGTKWHAIVSSDRSIGAVQAYKIYKNRWSIEVSYKELKQHLGLAKCQSRDFDAQIANTTISLMAYNLLACMKSANHYESIGFLFEKISSSWVQPNVMERFWNQFYKAMQAIADWIGISIEEVIQKAIDNVEFFSKLHNIKLKLGTET